MKIHQYLKAMFFGILLSTVTSSDAQVKDSTILTGPELKTFYSQVLKENRKITIHTPSKMNHFDRYPVLYVLDGESQASMMAGQVKYLSESYKIIPDMIVVGIENTDRIRDLTPTHSIIGPDGKPDTSARAFGRNSGGGENFLQFLHAELMPNIKQQYPAGDYNILAGHSLGGLLAVHSMLHHPGYFNGYIAISPSLQWDNKNLLLNTMAKLKQQKFDKTLFFFSDANEDAAFHQNQLELDSIIKKSSVASIEYKRMFYPEESHISEPVKAFYDGIRFIYPNWHLPYNSSAFRKQLNAKVIKDHYLSLSKKYGYDIKPLHDEIIQISRFLRNDPARINDAVELLQMNTVNYPQSAVVNETLGDTYMLLKKEDLALQSYVQAKQLDSTNASVDTKIQKLSK